MHWAAATRTGSRCRPSTCTAGASRCTSPLPSPTKEVVCRPIRQRAFWCEVTELKRWCVGRSDKGLIISLVPLIEQVSLTRAERRALRGPRRRRAGKALPLPRKALPLPRKAPGAAIASCVSAALAAKKLPLPCVAPPPFVAKTFGCILHLHFHCRARLSHRLCRARSLGSGAVRHGVHTRNPGRPATPELPNRQTEALHF